MDTVKVIEILRAFIVSCQCPAARQCQACRDGLDLLDDLGVE